MEGSPTYDALVNKGLVFGIEKGIEKGQIEHSQKTILQIGYKLIGQPSESSIDMIKSLQYIVVLDEIQSRLTEVSSWEELLSNLPSVAPKSSRRPRKSVG